MMTSVGGGLSMMQSELMTLSVGDMELNDLSPFVASRA